jgi:predicted DNA-binding transcriptional regulator AlpA
MTVKSLPRFDQSTPADDPSPTAPAATGQRNRSRSEDPAIQPRLITVEHALALGGIGRTTFYRDAARQKFIVRKLGRATRVDRASFEAYLDGLPAANFSTPKQSAA